MKNVAQLSQKDQIFKTGTNSSMPKISELFMCNFIPTASIKIVDFDA